MRGDKGNFDLVEIPICSGHIGGAVMDLAGSANTTDHEAISI